MTSGRVAGLFAGIGGLELGLRASGFETEMFCEIDPAAQRVLKKRFSGVPIEPDVTTMKALPEVDVVTAGFPCQDLSQAGVKTGITGSRSGLVGSLLRLVSRTKRRPKWVIIENVSYMLRLHQGQAMRFLTKELETLGYRWAYRVVDARSFGVPQRRLRVILLAARGEDPRDVLFADDVSDPAIITRRLQAPLVLDEQGPDVFDRKRGRSYGFYWTEGRIGIGWTTDAVPTIKGGSSLGIPSPPAVWIPRSNSFGVPCVADGERLQGLPPGWTEPATEGARKLGVRWRLIGNAVCASVSKWLGKRMVSPGRYRGDRDVEFADDGPWPLAAYGDRGKVRVADLSVWPIASRGKILTEFLQGPLQAMSKRAAEGFVDRARRTPKIRYAGEFIDALDEYIKTAPPNWRPEP